MPNNITDEKIDEILNLTDIVDVIDGYISLKKSGTNYTALCPFHKEKTPSFSVSPDKQIFHCFGCGEGGNAITFLMKYSHLSFVEALKVLADRAGIPFEVDQKYINQDYDQFKVHYKINREAAIFYQKQLYANEAAMKYLSQRGISDKAIKYFGLGYAADQWDGILKHLISLGYKEKDLEINGLIIRHENGERYYDRFRNRVMFPIFDIKKRIIGFGGRVLDHQLPKYINSPDSIIFNKGRHLYNLNHAKNNIEKNGIILAEGYMDVIKLVSHGFANVVASLGTALTENQIKLMKKFSKEFYISYDSDGAGLKAAVKAANLLKSNGLSCRILVFPEGMDPDDYISKFGRVKYKDRLNNAYEYFDFLDYYLSKSYETDSDKGKMKYIKEMSEHLGYVVNSIEKELYIEKISKKTGVSKESIIAEMVKTRKKDYNHSEQDIKKVSISINNKADYEIELLNLMKNSQDVIQYINKKYSIDTFEKTQNRDLFIQLLTENESANTATFKQKDEMYFPQDELLLVIEDYIAKIIIEEKKQERNEMMIKLLIDSNNHQLIEKISSIDKEILKLRGLLNG
ncbi:MAG: DNA primase [Tissierellales bacterium]|nr:DNA primase [Tissierellales bacterium]MBN2827043.1 DNA primase [Tissierellales bacterium]